MSTIADPSALGLPDGEPLDRRKQPMTKNELHKRISYVKSVLRLIGYAFIWPLSPVVLGVLFVSELLGIAEEVWGA